MKNDISVNELERRIHKIEERNRKVERDKAWETSYLRRIIIAILTYLVVLFFFLFNRLPNPFINALIPTIGFTLSTLTIGYIKKIWVNARKK